MIFDLNMTLVPTLYKLLNNETFSYLVDNIIRFKDNEHYATHLDFSNNEIGDKGAKFLTKLIEFDKSKIIYFDLSNNSISEKGIKVLHESSAKTAKSLEKK